MMLHDLAVIAKNAGLTVVEVDGWRHRTRPGGQRSVEGIVCHHTAGLTRTRAKGRNYPSLAVVRDGRRDVPGPLSHYGLGFDGTVYVIAAGRCNHAGKVSPSRWSSSRTIGIEAENSGTEPWPVAQYDAYVRLVRALCEHYKLNPDTDVRGHKEVAFPKGRKPDPSFDMNQFRQKVKSQVNNNTTVSGVGDDDMLRKGDKNTQVKQLQRTINGINHRTAIKGLYPELPKLTIDGIYGDKTIELLGHAHQRAQKVLKVDWEDDWTPEQVTPWDTTLLLQAAIKLGDV